MSSMFGQSSFFRLMNTLRNTLISMMKRNSTRPMENRALRWRGAHGGVGHLRGNGGGQEPHRREQARHIGHVARHHNDGHGLTDGPADAQHMAVAMPLRAAGTLTRNTVSIWVAPRARDASSYSRARRGGRLRHR